MRMKRRCLYILCLIAWSCIGLSCGGGTSSGTPGVEGYWNPVLLNQPGGFYCNNNDENIGPNNAVDYYFDAENDCDPNTEAIETEFFGTHQLRVAIYNADLFGVPNSATTVTINKIDLEYRRSADDVPGAPVLQSRTLYTSIALPPVSEEDTTDPAKATIFYVALFDVATKTEFADQLLTGERVPPDNPVRYTVVVTLHGVNVENNDLEYTFTVGTLEVGDWDYCECTTQ
jgi:hypothetical protein